MKLGSYIIIQGGNLVSCIDTMRCYVDAAAFYKTVYIDGKAAFMFDGSKVTVKELRELLKQAILYGCSLLAVISGKLMIVNTGDSMYSCFLHMKEIGRIVPHNKVVNPNTPLVVDGKVYEIVKEK